MSKCQKNADGKMAGVPTEGVDGAYALYSFKGADVKNIGTVGNVSIDGKMREYPENMTKYLDSYKGVGNYTSKGNNIGNITGSTIESCQKECNKKEECAGFSLNDDGDCDLKNKGMYPIGLRAPAESGHELYVRNKGIGNNNVSCSSEVVNTNAEYYGSFPEDGKMNAETLCDLGVITKPQVNALTKARTALQSSVGKLTDQVNQLSKEDAALNKSMTTEIGKLDTDLKDYKNLYNEAKQITTENITATGAAKDTDMNMISNNYGYIMWSILAITAVMAGMKYMK